MRRIGMLDDPDQAKRFSDYLFTQSIDCSVDSNQVIDDTGQTQWECDLWIRDEADVERAKQELEVFRQAPNADKYSVQNDAEKIRQQRAAEEERRKKLQRQVKHRSAGSGPLMGVSIRQQSIPVVIGVIVLSVIASFATNFGRPNPSQIPGELSTEEMVFMGLSFVDIRDYLATEDPFASIKQGEVWRFITPIFLHGDTYHLAFNMLALFFLGSAIERLQGSPFMAMLLLVSGVVGGLVQVWLPPADQLPEWLDGLSGSPFSIGASGAVYGLFGYLWVRPAMTPSYPVRMVPANVAIMLGWLVFCIFFVQGIANGAHIGGLLAGVVIAAVVAQLPSNRIS